MRAGQRPSAPEAPVIDRIGPRDGKRAGGRRQAPGVKVLGVKAPCVKVPDVKGRAASFFLAAILALVAQNAPFETPRRASGGRLEP